MDEIGTAKERREIRTNLTIRKDYCGRCSLYMDTYRVDTIKEINDCSVCYSGLRRGKDMIHILEKYKMV